MTDVFIAQDTVRALYSLDTAKTFEDQFSKVSVENILFYVVAVATWTLEKLFDRHKQEVTEIIDELRPHSLRWYANKAKAFQFGRKLIPDTDRYDNTGLTAEQIQEQQVVKYAAVEEKAAIVYVKVATGSEGDRKQLSAEQQNALEAYFKEVKDAGVKMEIVNEQADEFQLDIEVYYDPQIFDNQLIHQNTRERVVHDTIASFVENLPFNGEYRHSALINTLSSLEGVVLVDLKIATANGKSIDARHVPQAGYFRVNKETLGIKAIAYETVSDGL